MAKNPIQILTNGSSPEAKINVLVTEVEETGGLPRAWLNLIPTAVLGRFVTDQRLPEELIATAIKGLVT